jgi:hypothetical protein
MPAKLFSLAVDLALLPARTAARGASVLWSAPADARRLLAELRAINDEVANEVARLLASVDQEMQQRAGHLDPEQQQQAAELALHAAERHLDMAARDLLRALWLHLNASRRLRQERRGELIEHPHPDSGER